MEEFWMIVDIRTQFEARHRWDFTLPLNKKPGYCYTDKDRAEEELMRLKLKHPGGEFVLMHSVASAQLMQFNFLNRPLAVVDEVYNG